MSDPCDSTRKISSEFASRLAALGPEECIQAIVMLTLPSMPTDERPVSRADRRTLAARRVTESVNTALERMDNLLAMSGGDRLSSEANTTGTVSVCAPVSSIYLLAGQEWVKAIIEDQSIFPHRINTDA